VEGSGIDDVIVSVDGAGIDVVDSWALIGTEGTVETGVLGAGVAPFVEPGTLDAGAAPFVEPDSAASGIVGADGAGDDGEGKTTGRGGITLL